MSQGRASAGEITVGIVGGGFIAKAHAAAFHALPAYFPDLPPVRRLLLCDATEELARAAAGRLGFSEWAVGWQPAVARKDLDLLVVATPPDLHREISVSAARAGKHVLCEKPLARNAAEAAEMLREAQAAGILHVTGFNLRQSPALRQAHRLITEGAVGDPFHLSGRYFQDYGRDPSRPGNWRHQSGRAGGGAVTDAGSHLIDAARRFAGEVAAVTASARTLIAERPIAGGRTGRVEAGGRRRFRDPRRGVRSREPRDLRRRLAGLPGHRRDPGVRAAGRVGRAGSAGETGLKFGVYHLIWASPLSESELPALAERARRAGADVLEIATSREPFPFRPAAARRILADTGLEATLVTTVSAERDVGSEDPSARAAGTSFLSRYLDAAAELSSPLLCGPLYGPVWNPTLLSAKERADRQARCVESFARLAPEAQARGVSIALEPLSRFHTSFLNTVEDGLRLVDAIGHPAVGLLLDTFQMNIEEKDPGEAIRKAGARLYHFHASESDRGTPGTGNVDWPKVRDALRDVGYDGRLTIEAFNPDVPELAQFLKVWRRLEKDQDTLAREGIRFLRELMRGA